MPWNSAIEQEYMAMLDGVIGNAMDLPNDTTYPPILAKILIILYLKALERGDYEELRITPVSQTYLTYSEMRLLHLMRVACCLYAERNEMFPWRLRGKSADDLRPLLSIDYQGLYRSGAIYQFHHVWDVNPGKRMTEATSGYALLILFIAFGVLDIELPITEYDMICYLIQNLRDSGWGHMSGIYGDYAGYPNHGGGVYDYEIIREVKRTGCHTMSGYLVSMLRSFNIPAHIGRNPFHLHGHCYVHFSIIDKWLVHGDDVYSGMFKTIPPEFAFKSDQWMSAHAFGTTGYEYITASLYEEAFWWCILLGRSNNIAYDVRYLFHHNLLRVRLETLHEDIDWSQFEAPDPVPPIFNDDTVDFLMAWVEKKIQNEENG